MANREENLKKINNELEKLSDEELEKIAGGITEVIQKSGDVILDTENLSLIRNHGLL